MSKRYPLELETHLAPMRRPSLAEHAGEIMKTALEMRNLERREKLRRLIHHYDISEDDPEWQPKLLSALIEAHVPGFSVEDDKPKVGRPKDRWSVSRNLELIADIARMRLDSDRSVISACEELAKTEAYAALKTDPRSLQKRYNEAQKMPFAKMLVSLGLNHERPDLWAQFAAAYRDIPEVERLNNEISRVPNINK